MRRAGLAVAQTDQPAGLEDDRAHEAIELAPLRIREGDGDYGPIFIRRELGPNEEEDAGDNQSDRGSQHGAPFLAESETDVLHEDVGRGDDGHEHGGEEGDPPAARPPGEKNGSRPQGQGGQGLVGPAEVPPDDLEIDEVQRQRDREHGNDQDVAVVEPFLGEVEVIGQQPADAERRRPR